jgi:hypothetical protein
MKKVKHKKTGNEYFIVCENAICTTNRFSGEKLVIYTKNDKNEKIFVRDSKEFWEKFEEI